MREKDRGRIGYEFSRETKEEARLRANGRCEFPAFVCNRPNNQRVGHLTGIADGKFRGVVRESITHIDNTIVQCEGHDLALDAAQKLEILGIVNGTTNRTPFTVELESWLKR